MSTGSRIDRIKNAKKHRKFKPHSILIKMIKFCFLLLLLALIVGGALFVYYAKDAPELTVEDLRGQVASKIYDYRGELIKKLGGQNRELLKEEDIPPILEDAVLAIEDSRFYNHPGIDPIRIMGSLVANLKAGDIVQGGSTITQQLVKLSVFSTDFQDQTLERKAQEAWLSIQLEQNYSKKEILTLYLNKLFYSNNTYGAKTAAKNFFGKEINEINLAEAALLAGLPQAPSDYDPYAYPQAAKERRDLVLSVMLDRDLINQSDYQTAVDTPIESMLIPLSEATLEKVDLVIDAYLDLVAQELQDKMNINLYTDGVEVYTNMNYQAQEFLYNLVNNHPDIPFPDDKVQTASTVINVDTGQIQAIIGGRKQEVTMGLNRSNTLNRSVGSTMKPLSSYGPAIEYLDYSSGTLVVDEPYTYSNGNELYNYDFEYKGNQTIREALAGSRNIPALKTLQAVGLDNAYAFLQKLDINILNNNRRELVEANSIGGEITPIQLAAAYSAIANLGKYHAPYTVNRVITQSGTDQSFETEPRQAMKASTAYILTDILKGVPGTFASQAGIEGIHHAGKTGTTNYTDEQIEALGLEPGTYAAPDGWYAGFTPQYAIATWVGYDNPNEPGNYLTLEETAIPQHIYREMMTFLMKDLPIVDWKKPDNVTKVLVEKYTQPILLPGPYTPIEMQSEELFLVGREPKEQSLAYGRYVNPPTGFQAQFDEVNRQIHAQWDPMAEQGTFEFSVNGQVLYTGLETQYTIPAVEDGEYVLRLRIIDGVSSSDTLVYSLTISGQSSQDESEETSEINEDNQESTDIESFEEGLNQPFNESVDLNNPNNP